MDQGATDLAIATAAKDCRPALAALLALDRRLGEIVRSTREPLIGRMRLTWWREALERLDGAPPPAEPLLADLARVVLPWGVTGSAMAAITTGWEALLLEPIDDETLALVAARGAALFALAAHLLGAEPPSSAGAGWALADVAARLGDGDGAVAARARATDHLAAAFAQSFAPRARPLGVLALLAALHLRGGRRPLRDTVNLVGFRLTGRHRLEIG